MTTDRNKPRFLISTSDQRTWRYDCPVVFLGEWCFRKQQQEPEIDASVVAPPFTAPLKQRLLDLSKARNLEREMFAAIVPQLNRHHKAQMSTRFWKIVLGQWLRRCIEVLTNRYTSLEICNEKFNISGGAELSSPLYSLATLDSASFVQACEDAIWNDHLFARIRNLSTLDFPKFEKITVASAPGFRRHSTLGKHTLKQKIYRGLSAVTKHLSHNSDYFVLNSYLPTSYDIRLHLALRQPPQFWARERASLTSEADESLRASLTEELSKQFTGNLERLAAALIWELMPISYLEGFREAQALSMRMRWPRRPKAIFTSNNFDSDDVFKIWAANKIENGSQYIIGQHGNDYGTLWDFEDSIEEEVPDRFLTWGWKSTGASHVKSFILKLPKSGMLKSSANGKLLLVGAPAPRQLALHDTTYLSRVKLDNQLDFARHLDAKYQNKLVVRLHSNSTMLQTNDQNRWKANFPQATVQFSRPRIYKSISSSRFVVFAYDSTGLLETLSQNIPSIAFWTGGFDHLRQEVVPHYQILLDAGIIHFNPKSAADKVNSVFDDVDAWWQTENVQRARLTFCSFYARQMEDPIGHLVKSMRQ